MNRRSFLNGISLAPAAILAPSIVLGGAEANAALNTWPHIIYKENDGILADLGPADTESFVFNVLVRGENRNIEPQGARLKFYSSGERVNEVQLSKKALNAVRGASISSAGDLDREEEVFDLRHHFSMPVSLNVDRLVYNLTVAGPGASGVEKTLDIPLLRYEQKTKLTFPIKGKFMVVAGHEFNEAHSFGRSQHFAYDIFGMGPHWEITRNGGATIADFCTWGREVIAPADGWSCTLATMFPTNHGPGPSILPFTSICRTQVTRARETTCYSTTATASTARSAICSTDRCESRQEIG